MTDPNATREIGPFVDSVDNIRCPSCHHPHSFQDLNMEGGTHCDGCGRRLSLKIESYPEYGEWRNVPKGMEEQYR
jgi:hypothetical protein